jgi:hypothetical protein
MTTDQPSEPTHYWWCIGCKVEVIPERVTYDERHDACGYRVVSRAEKPSEPKPFVHIGTVANGAGPVVKPSEPTGEALHPADCCSRYGAERDRKWMAGVEAACGCAIDFDPLGSGRGTTVPPPTLSDFVRALKARVAELEGERDAAINAGHEMLLEVSRERDALSFRIASLTEDVADLQREKNNAGALAMEYMRERDDARKDARVREETIETLRASLAKRNTELLGTEAQLATVTRERGLAESRIVNAARVVENWSNRANEMEARAERLEQALRNIADQGAWGYVDDSGCPKPYGREAWIGDSHPIDIATAALSAPPSGTSASTEGEG